MNADQAEAIISTVTGLPVGNLLRLEVAWEMADLLTQAVRVLDEDGDFCVDPECRDQNHYELKA